MPTQPEIVDLLIASGQERKFYIGITNKQTNAAGAFVRLQLGWRADSDEAKKVVERASRIVKAGLGGKAFHADDADIGARLLPALSATAKAIELHVEARAVVELGMRRATRSLAASSWAKDVRGLGEIGLAIIVAEAGDLYRYSDVRKLWKRLGLAPHQGQAYSTWRRTGGLTAEDWIKAGYSPRRRAEIYACVGEPLIRAQKPGMPYRDTYDRRRARTAETHPDWTPGHSHADALRVMTKRLIFDLWSEWRRPIVPVAKKPNLDVASVDITVTASSGNIFADLGLPNAEALVVAAEQAARSTWLGGER